LVRSVPLSTVKKKEKERKYSSGIVIIPQLEFLLLFASERALEQLTEA
jgi:hypothetical protein